MGGETQAVEAWHYGIKRVPNYIEDGDYHNHLDTAIILST